MKVLTRIISVVLCFVIIIFSISPSLSVRAAGISWYEGGVWGKIISWLGGTDLYDMIMGTDHSGNYVSTKPQAYYTTPTESVEDQYGNVTNYYRGGDTTTTQILDSYNHTLNTIHNVSNTNNYSANVQLENFLNNYTTNNNNYTYNTEYKSWYYDNTSNTYNFDNSQTYYNTDNSQYYISIDNSTDEYYLVDVQYSPTFVTVNYTYNTTNNTTNNYGNVTNVYYYELTDGRNSADLTVDDVLGLDLGYDVTNYELITDDDNTLSLQHFDGDYVDVSSYANEFYSEIRSTTYVDSGAFGNAVKLTKGAAAGVSIPGLSGKDGLTFDFRIYYDKIGSLGIYLGDTNLFALIPESASVSFWDPYLDHGVEHSVISSDLRAFDFLSQYSSSDISYSEIVTDFSEVHTVPSTVSDLNISYSKRYGYPGIFSVPKLVESSEVDFWDLQNYSRLAGELPFKYEFVFLHSHYREFIYESSVSGAVATDFAYSSYVNQWVSMRITILDGFIWYFVNGDQVGCGKFTMPSADEFYIKSSGTLYLDELRVSTGDMVYTDTYVPSNGPYDTNKVLALPSELAEDVIYVRSSVDVTSWRVGGVRPSNPSKGFLYIPIYSDNTGGQSQIYDGNNWINVDSVIYNGSTFVSTKGFKFSTVGDSVDITTDNSSGSGSGSGDSSDTCDHTWEFTESIEAGTDEDGEETAAYDLYTCSKCGEVYYDYDQTGSPPSSSGSGSSGSSDNFLVWLGEKLGELFGVIADGFLALLEATLGKVLDALISLVTMAVEKLTQIATLFGSFANSLGALWSWLPSDIQLVLSAGVTIFVFLAVIRFFFK